MSMSGYTKLFNSILASTIWREDDKTRIVWITLLAMADKNGVAEGSVPGLADFARVSIKDCEMALEKLQEPDPHSRSKEHAGRRIKPIDGGWLLLNHAKYRAKMGADERREYEKLKKREYRAADKANVPDTSTSVHDVPDTSTLSTHAEAEAKAATEAEAEASLLPATAESAEFSPVQGEGYRKPTTRDPLLEVIVQSTGGNVNETTKSAWGAAASALKQIRAVAPDLTAEEIQKRAANYRARHPDWQQSPTALAKHWSTIKHSGRELV